ncbi:MAG: anti-sigma factor antagonist [Oscillospiraceae bacterium]|nr:anti-sigma factor antagonist [Oscillospiraceae bacterium]
MVELKYDSDRKSLAAVIIGEIDHHSAEGMRDKIDEAIYVFKPHKIILDFTSVSFMDSSGIGLIMGRYRTSRYHGGEVFVKVKDERIKKILSLSGIDKLVSIIGGKNEDNK